MVAGSRKEERTCNVRPDVCFPRQDEH